MWKFVRGFAVCAVLLAGLAVVAPAAVRADDPTQDYNEYWQIMTSPTPPAANPNDDYNTYWQDVQLQQQWQDRNN